MNGIIGTMCGLLLAFAIGCGGVGNGTFGDHRVDLGRLLAYLRTDHGSGFDALPSVIEIALFDKGIEYTRPRNDRTYEIWLKGQTIDQTVQQLDAIVHDGILDFPVATHAPPDSAFAEVGIRDKGTFKVYGWSGKTEDLFPASESRTGQHFELSWGETIESLREIGKDGVRQTGTKEAAISELVLREVSRARQ